ncbi:MAG: hypothetical protein HY048_11410 [Acidobacteria bacterium]|nr:hypothetical protein [Acidobacteriota bacterium]
MKKTLAAILSAALLTMSMGTAACSDPTPPAAPTPVTPTVTETFTGTLTLAGNNSHPFVVNQVGGLRLSLTGVSPSAAVGIGVGTPSTATGTCTLLANLTAVGGPGVQMSGTATIAGGYCIAVFDVGNLVESVNYTITVLHS